MSRQPALFHHGPRFVRFGLVGSAGIAGNMATLYLLAGIDRLNPAVAGAMATEAAILSNLALNDRRTFRNGCLGTARPQRAVRYNAVTFWGLLMPAATLTVLIRLADLHYFLATLFAIAAATVGNYTCNSRLTWLQVTKPGSPHGALDRTVEPVD